ncbi:HEPN domain-containing protein [Erythrobacter oryzae]|uniref:HEPN domain-containing protein n=1 Tax=Erythrobacter oryzae TaxID=3019556 RepID=UPI003AF32196
MRLSIDSRELSLGNFITRCSGNEIPEDVRAAMRVHSVVQLCGYIERSMEVIVLTRIEKRAHPRLIDFVKSYFKKGTNFRCSVIKSFLERFDTRWARNFQDFMDANDDVVELVNSAYSLRNRAAHGDAIQLSDRRLIELFDGAKRAVQGIIDATA